MGASSVSFFHRLGSFELSFVDIVCARTTGLTREIASGVRSGLSLQKRLCGSAAMADASGFFFKRTLTYP